MRGTVDLQTPDPTGRRLARDESLRGVWEAARRQRTCFTAPHCTLVLDGTTNTVAQPPRASSPEPCSTHPLPPRCCSPASLPRHPLSTTPLLPIPPAPFSFMVGPSPPVFVTDFQGLGWAGVGAGHGVVAGKQRVKRSLLLSPILFMWCVFYVCSGHSPLERYTISFFTPPLPSSVWRGPIFQGKGPAPSPHRYSGEATKQL